MKHTLNTRDLLPNLNVNLMEISFVVHIVTIHNSVSRRRRWKDGRWVNFPNSVIYFSECCSPVRNHVWQLTEHSEDDAICAVWKAPLTVCCFETKGNCRRISKEVCEIIIFICLFIAPVVAKTPKLKRKMYKYVSQNCITLFTINRDLKYTYVVLLTHNLHTRGVALFQFYGLFYFFPFCASWQCYWLLYKYF
jgi:hypothetical protein